MNHILRVLNKYELDFWGEDFNGKSYEDVCNEIINSYNNGERKYRLMLMCPLEDIEGFLFEINYAIQKTQIGELYYNGHDKYNKEDVLSYVEKCKKFAKEYGERHTCMELYIEFE